MKNVLAIAMIVLCTISAGAQIKDRNGRVVSQNGDVYKVTFNHTSNNGGTASEIWTGRLVNGKREGVWKFTGTYQKYERNDNVFYTGTASVSRTYKNGIPNGSYSVNYDLQACNGGYNIFTDTWVYKTPIKYRETVSGAFVNGKANGSWKIYSSRTNETMALAFKDGLLNGELNQNKQNPKIKAKASFVNGYLKYRKTFKDDEDWGYETNYGTNNPAELQPQDTVSVNTVNSLLTCGFTLDSDYVEGLYLASHYIEHYPENSSDETIKADYIVSDYETFNSLWGNVPEDVIKTMEWESRMAEERKFKAEDAKMEKQLHALIDSHIETLDPAFRNFIEGHELTKYYVHDYVQSDILPAHPEIKEFVEAQEKKVEQAGGGASSSILWYIEPLDSTHTFKYLYQRVYDRAMEQVLEHHGADNDSTRYYTHQYYVPIGISGYSKRIDERWEQYLTSLEEKYRSEIFQLTEEDIQYYLVLKYGYQYISGSSYVLTSKDASEVTREEVEKFAKKHINWDTGERNYRGCVTDRMLSLAKMFDSLHNTKKFKKLRETVSFSL